MDISIFLAKALGLYLLIMSIAMLINTQRFTSILNDIIDRPSLLLFGGVIALILGILMVLTHNLWVGDWRVLITIIAWLSLIKGVIRVGFSQLDDQFIRYFVRNKKAYYISAVITLLLGVVFIYFGFR